MSNITLSQGIRSNLLTLQQTASQRETIQGRLATGKRVNSALDNPTNFFTAQSLNSRANDLSGLLDGISNAIKTLEAADKGIKSITKLVESAQAIARQAKQASSVTGAQTSTAWDDTPDAVTTAGDLTISFGTTASTNTGGGTLTVALADGDTLEVAAQKINNAGGAVRAEVESRVTSGGVTEKRLTLTSTNGRGITVDSATITAGDIFDAFDTAVEADAGVADTTARANFAAQFNEIRTQINRLAEDSGFNGVNLLTGGNLTVTFNEKVGTNAKLDVRGKDFTATGLSIADATVTYGSFATDGDIDTALNQLQSTLNTIRTRSAEFGSNLSVVQTRQDFTKDIINTLKTGADNLTNADTNEEGANLLALNTRAQLATTSLSFASQADQQVLQFLR